MNFTTNWTLPEFNLDYLKGRDLKIFEIGCFEGRSTCWWFENVLITPNCVCECIDPWEGYDPNYGDVEDRFDSNTKGLNIIKNKMSSYEWFRKNKNTFDFGYIDGWHEGFQVLEDLVLGWHCIKEGGFLICDDYYWDGKVVIHPPKPAIDCFIKLHPDCNAEYGLAQVKLNKTKLDVHYWNAKQ